MSSTCENCVHHRAVDNDDPWGPIYCALELPPWVAVVRVPDGGAPARTFSEDTAARAVRRLDTCDLWANER